MKNLSKVLDMQHGCARNGGSCTLGKRPQTPLVVRGFKHGGGESKFVGLTYNLFGF